MSILPDDICGFLSLHYFDIFPLERESVELKSLVISIFCPKCAEEHFRDKKLLKVCILVLSHLLLNLLCLFKITFTKSLSALGQEILHLIVVKCKLAISDLISQLFNLLVFVSP